MNLAELQTEFQGLLLDKQCRGADWIADSNIKLSPQERMGIYHNAYRVRLVGVLLENFEHTGLYLGDDWFYKLAHAYVQSHPPMHHNIAHYGEQFPEFLAEQLADDLEVAELALMDWTLRRAFDGADSRPLSSSDLQQLIESDGGSARLKPVPTLTVTTQSHNTLDIWHAINSENTPPTVEGLENSIDILIWRKEHSPHFRSMLPIEADAINGLLRGHTLDQIGEWLVENHPQANAANEFGLMLQNWVNDEVLAL